MRLLPFVAFEPVGAAVQGHTDLSHRFSPLRPPPSSPGSSPSRCPSTPPAARRPRHWRLRGAERARVRRRARARAGRARTEAGYARRAARATALSAWLTPRDLREVGRESVPEFRWMRRTAPPPVAERQLGSSRLWPPHCAGPALAQQRRGRPCLLGWAIV